MNEHALEVAAEAFEIEYTKTFPTGGDLGDHQEAVREGVAAAIEAYQAEAMKPVLDDIEKIMERHR